MSKRKASKARKEASKKAHEARGSGSKSRISLDFEKLNAGWTIEERPSSSSRASLQFSYRNPEGKSLKSAEDVKRQLDAEGRLEEFESSTTENRNQVQNLRSRLSNDLPSSDETDDSDYEPPVEKKTPKEIKHNKG